MCLMGYAFAVYEQLNDTRKRDFGSIKDALFTAFAMNSHAVYVQFVVHHLHPGEIVDIFLVDLWKFFMPFDSIIK